MKTKASAMRLTATLLSFALIQVTFGPEAWAQVVRVNAVAAPVGGASAAAGALNAGGSAAMAMPSAAFMSASLLAVPAVFLSAPSPSASVPAEASRAPGISGATPEEDIAATPSAQAPAAALESGPRTAGIGARMSRRIDEFKKFFTGRHDSRPMEPASGQPDAVARNNPLKDLNRFGVSPWYDNVSRALISSGELKRLIEEDGVRGLTSNPTIFEKAIGGSADYDASIRRHARPNQTSAELFELLAVEDIQAAGDALRPLYDESKGADGFVSLEVAPRLAKDAEGTVAEAKRLWARVARPNLMIKVPGTPEGVRAFEDLTAEGISVNVTLLFAQERYAEIAEAYVKGLERRAAAGKDLSRIASVASFFVSRVDAAIDAVLEKRPEPEAKALLGKAAIANAKLAYQHYKQLFGSPRFATLAAKGAKPQRLLWASTGTKNPLYRDVVYVEELIGPGTVNTMPPATVDAYRDHGVGRPSLEEHLDEARAQWEALPRYGVDIPAVLAKLAEDGLRSFAKSFETLMDKLAAKAARPTPTP